MIFRLYYDQSTLCARGIFAWIGRDFLFSAGFLCFASIFGYIDTYSPGATKTLTATARKMNFFCINTFVQLYFWILAMLNRKNWFPLWSRAQNPRWPPSKWYGHTNFFPNGDKFKIIFSSIGFWGTGNALELFTPLCARYLAEFGGIWPFSAVFKHFPSIHQYFDLWITILVVISMFWGTTN